MGWIKAIFREQRTKKRHLPKHILDIEYRSIKVFIEMLLKICVTSVKAGVLSHVCITSV